VSALKGVIFSINPHVHIVDIAHQIGPQDVFEAAFTLLVNYRFFPKDTIHVAVVDPGVGSKRRILCAKTSSGIFVGPDNGIFAPILDREKKVEVREVTNSKLFLPIVSNTFHGRDKMAPVAAYLSRGLSVKRVGPQLKLWKKIPFERPKISSSKINGHVISIDRFGNLITNITRDDLLKMGGRDNVTVRIKNHIIPKMVRFFGEVPKGRLLAIVGSSDFVEIAKNLGSAAELLRVKMNDPVEIVRKRHG